MRFNDKVIDSCPMGLVVINEQLEIVQFNTAAVLLLNTGKDQAMGSRLSEVLFDNPEAQKGHDRFMKSIFELGVTDRNSMRKRPIRYGDKMLSISLKLIKEEGAMYCAAFVIDMTETLNLQEEIKKLEAQLSSRLTTQEQIQLKSSDVRVKFISYIFGTILFCSIGLMISDVMSDEKSATKTVELLVASLLGSLSTTTGYYFRSKDDA